MKMRRVLKLVAIVLCGLFGAAAGARAATAAGDTAKFDVANQMYVAGKYDEAMAAYNQLERSGPISANLYYDIGNTSWKLGDGGEAAANYVRALELDPSHPQARANLDFVREQLGSKVPTPMWWENVLSVLDANVATVVAAICVWAVLFCVAIMILRANRVGPILTLVICVLTGAYAGGCIWEASVQGERAIVIATSLDARAAPAEAAPVTDTLPAGSEVSSPEVRGDWTYCMLPSGTPAWVPTKGLERVTPG
jgi:tetratricopeptide (TPR) repeat protein